MGISTIQSYCGAQIFEAVGLEQRRSSTATSPAPRRGSAASASTCSPRETLDRHAQRLARPTTTTLLPVGGVYAWRRDGEHHMWNPETIALLQHAVRVARTATRRRSTTSTRALVNEDATRRATLRGLLRFRDRGVEPIPLDEVEPAKEIVKRFATGAMSLGSISTRGARDARRSR